MNNRKGYICKWSASRVPGGHRFNDQTPVRGLNKQADQTPSDVFVFRHGINGKQERMYMKVERTRR